MVAETTNAPALRPRRWLRRSKWMRVRATDDANTSRWQSKPALSDDLAKSRPDDNIELSRWPLHWMDRRRFWARSTSRSPSVAWWSTQGDIAVGDGDGVVALPTEVGPNPTRGNTRAEGEEAAILRSFAAGR